MEHVGACVYVKDEQGRFIHANAAMCGFFGVPFEQAYGKTAADFLDPQSAFLIHETDLRVLETGVVVHEREDVVLRDGSLRSFWSVKVPLRENDGAIVGTWGVSTEITNENERIAGHSRLLGTLLESTEAYIFLKDHEGRYLYANERTLDLYGRGLEEVIGRTDEQLLTPSVAAQVRAVDEQVLSSMQRFAGEERVLGADGRWRRFWTVKVPLKYPGMEPGLLGFATDITELLELRRDLQERRTTDVLTGLANREQFLLAVDNEIPMLRVRGRAGAVVYLDLDEFKYVNSYLGQEVGNRLLCQVASRLREALPESAWPARMGADDFALVLAPVADEADVEAHVRRLRERLAQPYDIQGRSVQLVASAGVAMMPEDGEDAQSLLEHAEAAMYVAKHRGRAQQVFYESAMMTATVRRVDLENALRSALAAGQFELHYQPKVHADGSLASFEALLRWNRPGHGTVSPLEFIPLAERLGLLVEIGEWVIQEACKTMAAWREAGLGRIPVAVNLSLSQLHSPHLLAVTISSIKTHAIGPGELGMEVTESMMLRDPEQSIAVLHSLVDAGVELSIDDFGTGYCSMAYLKLLPVRWLKLDRQFVKDMHTDRRDAAICAGMIALAHELDLAVVAEGVECPGQQQMLVDRGCEQFQGFLFSKPLPLREATRYLSESRRRQWQEVN